jgi:hypothetical protein
MLSSLPFDTGKSSPEDVKLMLQGNIEAIAKLVSENMGIHQTLVESLLCGIKNDPDQLIEVIGKLAAELKINPNLLKTFTKISLSNYNPDIVGIKSVDGNVIMHVKDLFKTLFPSINVEIFDGLLQIVTESDPRPL